MERVNDSSMLALLAPRVQTLDGRIVTGTIRTLPEGETPFRQDFRPSYFCNLVEFPARRSKT